MKKGKMTEGKPRNPVQKDTSIVIRLKTWHIEAFGLRMRGLQHNQIAKSLGVSDTVVRSLFAKNGRLYKFWQEYRQRRMEDVFDEVAEILYGNLPDTCRALVVQAKEQGMDGNIARKIHLEYTMGKMGLQQDKVQATTLHELAKLADERDASKQIDVPVAERPDNDVSRRLGGQDDSVGQAESD